MAMSSLTYIPDFSVKFFFQPIYTDYANQPYFEITFKSSLKPQNQIKANLAGVVPFQYCVQQPCPPFKMAAVTKNRNFFRSIFALLQIKINSNFYCSYMAMSRLTYILGFSVRFFQPIYSVQEYYEIKITSKSFAQKFELK